MWFDVCIDFFFVSTQCNHLGGYLWLLFFRFWFPLAVLLVSVWTFIYLFCQINENQFKLGPFFVFLEFIAFRFLKIFLLLCCSYQFFHRLELKNNVILLRKNCQIHLIIYGINFPQKIESVILSPLSHIGKVILCQKMSQLVKIFPSKKTCCIYNNWTCLNSIFNEKEIYNKYQT